MTIGNDCADPLTDADMGPETTTIADKARKELALLLVCLFFGLLVLPAAIFAVGMAFFGDYGGAGFSGFYGGMHGSVRSFDPVVWFLVLSPYLVIQCLRGTFRLFHAIRAT